MRALRTIVVVLLVALGFLGGYFVGWYLHGENVVRLTTSQTNDAKKAGDLQQRIIEELEGRYYKAVDVDKLSTAGVNGTLKSLKDPYTVYLSPEEAKALATKMSGQFFGIGATLQKGKKGLAVARVIAGSPAEKAGLKPGDIIVTVDGQPTAAEAVEVSVARIRGEEGTPVKLGIEPSAGGPFQTLDIVRRRIEVPETRRTMERAGGEKVGYVQLFAFEAFAARDVRRDVDALANRGAQAFILDLRYNGGGLLGQAVDVTGIFQTGVVTSTEGLHSPKEVLETDGPVATGKPLVLLVNGYSASASEIVTGALKDHQRAEIIGTRTFGKGLVQDTVPLGNGAALHLTIAVYLTPNGTDINKKGIVPDIVVRDDPKTKKDEQLQAALKYLAGKK
ncbi:MAG: S41 family peptidase [Actinobacteria bacterium]|nr:S41 family peptidase [Actinomycetota bacterium]